MEESTQQKPKKVIPFSRIRGYVIIISFLIIAFGIGYQFGEKKIRVGFEGNKPVLINSTQPKSEQVDFSLFWDVWQKMFRTYIDASTLDPTQMVYGAISGMVNAAGDPYSVFLPPKENQEFKDDLGGSFEGIGAQLGLKDGRIVVIAPLKDNPAEKAGIKPGDWILTVNDEETTGWSVQQAVTKIRGPRGTTVNLEILHEKDNTPVKLSLVRDTILISSVISWVKTPGEIKEIENVSDFKLSTSAEKIAYIQLTRFGDRTNDEWGKAIDEIVSTGKKSKLKGLVFDLRNNPGGYLEGSVFIASEFMKSGVVVSQVNSNGTREDYRVMRTGQLLDIPMVVLVNKGSASAAEIVAGALRDTKRAKLVGETTFGKGSVQTPEDLPGGAGLHITTGKWLLPSGDWIHKTGVKPDIEITEPVSEASGDAQLAKAIELLLK